MNDGRLPDGLVGGIVLCEILCTSICHAIVDEYTENTYIPKLTNIDLRFRVKRWNNIRKIVINTTFIISHS